MSSRIDWPLAPSETIALNASECAAAWISISPPTEKPIPPIRSGSTSGRLWRYLAAACEVAVAGPAEDVRIALARALAAAVEEEDAVAVLDEHARVLLRAGAAGKAITVAPLREGMNQPSSRSPSLVVKETSSGVAPRFGVGTTARAVCVRT